MFSQDQGNRSSLSSCQTPTHFPDPAPSTWHRKFHMPDLTAFVETEHPDTLKDSSGGS